MMKSRLGVLFLAVIGIQLVAGFVSPAAASDSRSAVADRSAFLPPRGRIFFVDCDRPNRSLARVIERSRPGDTIEVNGTCHERIRISKGPLTIDGGGNAIIDGSGLGPSASEFNGLVTVDGAQGVTLRGLAVQNNPAEGVLGKGGADFRLENVMLQGHFRGILLSNSSAELHGVTIVGGVVGFQAVAGSSVVITGDVDVSRTSAEAFALLNADGELRGGTLDVHDNSGMFNFIVVGGSTFSILGFEASSESRLHVHSNPGHGPGILLGNGTLEIGGAPPTPSMPVVESSANGGPGIVVTAGGRILNAAGWGRIVVNGNPVGITADTGSILWMNGGLEVSGNSRAGVAVSGSKLSLSPGINPVSITGNGPAGDLVLSFGAQSRIGAGVTVGTVVCDASVLSTGATTC